MSDAANLRQKRPLSADLIRSVTEVPIASLKEINKLFELLAESLKQVLAGFSPVACRVECDGIAEVVEPTPIPDAIRARFFSQPGALEIWVSGDKGFVLALCDLSFGGTGHEPAYDSEERPLSKIERRLSHLALEEFVCEFPAVLERALGTAFEPHAEPPGQNPPDTPPETSLVSGRLLVNLFGYSGEVRIHLNRKDVLAIVPGGRGPASRMSASVGRQGYIGEQVNHTAITLRVSLAPETMPIGAIGTLKPGQLIRLSSTVHSPVLVSNEDVQLFSATLVSSSGRLAIRVNRD